MSLVIGFDVGGTTMTAGLVDAQGHLHGQKEVETLAEQPVGDTLARMKALLADLLGLAADQGQSVSGIGIGMAGLIEPQQGIVQTSPNLPNWSQVHLAQELAQVFHLPVVIDNDVRAATLGEAAFGAGQGKQHLIMLTVGTGIGSALVLNGEIYRGSCFSAGEFGHMPVIPQGGLLCGCGSQGCLETVAGTKAILILAHRLIERGFCPVLQARLNSTNPLTPRLIAEAAQAGDAGACRVWEEIGTWLGMGLAGLVNLLNPEQIIIGGGIAQAGEVLFAPIRREIRRRAFALPAEAATVVPAQLGPDAGVIGASVLGRKGVI